MVAAVIVGLVYAPFLVGAFRRRREPEPRNNPLKLPGMLILLGVCIWLAVDGIVPWLFAPLAVLIAVQVPLILRGRNPWWMQAPMDRKEKGALL